MRSNSQQSLKNPPNSKKQIWYTCTYQGYQGRLTANNRGCVFTSELMRADFPWDTVKWVRMTTKYVKDAPTSVLAIKTTRQKTLSTLFVNTNKHYFYHFKDIVEAANQIQELKDASDLNDVEVSPGGGGEGTGNSDSNNDNNGKNGKSPAGVSNSSLTSFKAKQIGNENSISNVNSESTGADASPRIGKLTNGVATSSIASPLDDGDISSFSGTRGRKTNNNLRNEIEEEVEGKQNSGCGSNIPLHMGVNRGNETKENISATSQQRRGTALASPSISMKNRTRQNQLGGPSFTTSLSSLSWFDFIISNISNNPRKVAEIFLGSSLVLLLTIIIILSLSGGNQWREPYSHEKVKNVLNGLEQLQQWKAERKKIMLEGNQQSLDKNNVPLIMTISSTPPLRISLDDMTMAIKELLEKYVTVQRDIVALRINHLRRKRGDLAIIYNARRRALTEVVIKGTIDDNKNEIKKGLEELGDNDEINNEPPPRHFSIQRVTSDIRILRLFFSEFFNTIKWILMIGGGNNNYNNIPTPIRWFNSWWKRTSTNNNNIYLETENKERTSYTEVLPNGQIISQDVSLEEDKERRTCLQYTTKLVRLAELLETILLEYQDVVMAPQYEAYLHRVRSALEATRSTSSSYLHEISVGGGVEEDGLLKSHDGNFLRAILLRRHTLALLNLEPLFHWERFHYYEAIRQQHRQRQQQQRKRSKLQKKYGGFSQSRSNLNNNNNGNTSSSPIINPTKEDIELIIKNFILGTTRRHGSSDLALLRNILQEVKYWHEHEEDWQNLVHWRLNISNVNKNPSENFNSEIPDNIEEIISSMPIFRGMWCFLEKPIQYSEKKDLKYSDKFKSFLNSNDSAKSQNSKKNSNNLDSYNSTKENSSNKIKNVEEIQLQKMNKEEEEKQKEQQQQQEKERDNSTTKVEINTEDGLSDEEPIEEVKENEELEKEEEKEEKEDVEIDEDPDTQLRTLELMSQEVQLRWLNAFELFLRVHNDGQGLQTRCNTPTCTNARLEREEEAYNNDGDSESMDLQDMIQIRRKLIQLLVWVERQYGRFLPTQSLSASSPLADFTFSSNSNNININSRRPSSSSSSLGWWLSWLWPPSWWGTPRRSHYNYNYISSTTTSSSSRGSSSSSSPLQGWLARVRAGDPVVRRLYRDALRVPLGEAEDVPWVLLHCLRTPPELLRVQYEAQHALRTLLCVFILAVLAIIALAMLH